MKYMGSKDRISKYIIPLMLKDRKDEQYWVEPFVGGANSLDKVTGNRIGNDYNDYLAAMWQDVSNGWMPPNDVTEEQYSKIKNNKELYPKGLVAYVGFALSYGGKWFGGWCRDGQGKRNYVIEAYNNAIKQFPKLRGITFTNQSYDEMYIPPNSLIYCDPPYKNTTKYKNDFDSDKFYNWCVSKVKDGHTVFVSEYEFNYPNFIKLWEKEITSSLTQNTGSKTGIECLYKVQL